MPNSICIYGFHSVEAQLESSPECIVSVNIFENRTDKRLLSLIKLLDRLDISYRNCSKKQLDKLANNQKHQGIVAEILLPVLPSQNELEEYIDKLDNSVLILILDSIQDPRNLGACLRSANAVGVDCVIINKDGSAPINALVHKTSAGALNQLKIFQVTNLARTIRLLKNKNIWVIGLDGNSEQSIYSIDLTSSSAIVMGSEGSGLRNLTKQSCDQLALIPMNGNIESLNVSVATGISLFEATRQRNFNN
jgi:23S rRNA (guanosine2251-2'-O)-methyltransferase